MDIVAERIFEEVSAAGTAHALPLNFRSVPEVCEGLHSIIVKVKMRASFANGAQCAPSLRTCQPATIA